MELDAAAAICIAVIGPAVKLPERNDGKMIVKSNFGSLRKVQ
jgi:hypothetical protein